VIKAHASSSPSKHDLGRNACFYPTFFDCIAIGKDL